MFYLTAPTASLLQMDCAHAPCIFKFQQTVHTKKGQLLLNWGHNFLPPLKIPLEMVCLGGVAALFMGKVVTFIIAK